MSNKFVITMTGYDLTKAIQRADEREHNEPLTTMVAHLRRCRLAACSNDKRYVRQLSVRLDRGDDLDVTLTEKQQAYLRSLRHKYRKQIAANKP